MILAPPLNELQENVKGEDEGDDDEYSDPDHEQEKKEDKGDDGNESVNYEEDKFEVEDQKPESRKIL